ANPMPYFHMNSARAGILRDAIEAASQDERWALELAYVKEMLWAGHTREAVNEMLRMESTLPGARRITPATRAFYDLLGIAFLRLGELENCAAHSGSSSCIFPIERDGIHARTNGALGASRVYAEILNTYPADLRAQWLYNFSLMALGEWPDGGHPRFLLRNLQEKGTSFPRFLEMARSAGMAGESISGGVSADDFNGDGLLDLLVTSYGLHDQMRLYLNDGAGTFEEKTDDAGLSGIVSGLNTVHADFDNDGHVDILVLRGAWLGDVGEHPNSLLRNRGDGTFEDVTFEAGIGSLHPSHSAAWADFDLDGHLDLFIGNESGSAFDLLTGSTSSTTTRRSELYRNNGDGTFTEVSEAVGVNVQAFVKGSVWCDVTNDGLPDLYVSVLGEDNLLFINLGADENGGWSFADRAPEAGVSEPVFSFPVGCFDVDQDGHEDLVVMPFDVRRFDAVAADAAAESLGMRTDAETPRLYLNRGDGTFAETASSWRLRAPIYAMGFNYGDLDNDGWLDIYVGTGAPDLGALVPNRMFRNRGDRFEDVTGSGGFGHVQKGHAIAFADFTNTGRSDVFANMGGAVEGDRFRNALFVNPGFDHEWISLQLEGRSANRSSVGARIRIRVEEADGRQRDIFRTVSTGGSFGASPLRQTIGLGNATSIVEVDIQWPDANDSSQVFTDLEVGEHYRIVQGEPPRRRELQSFAFRTGETTQ
ncbi:MAG: CRTAC1 family protein, partial [Rhodothermales bacterium]